MHFSIIRLTLIATFFLDDVHRGTQAKDSSRIIRQLLYPAPSSKVQWVFGLGLPAKVDSKSVNFGLSMKLNYYTLPINASQIVYPFADIKERRSEDMAQDEVESPGSRWEFYNGVEAAIERLLGDGHEGLQCMQRAICEAAAKPFFSEQHGGLAEEILDVILSPSGTPVIGDSIDDKFVASTYLRAENLGREGFDCIDAFPGCPTSLLELISTIIPIN